MMRCEFPVFRDFALYIHYFLLTVLRAYNKSTSLVGVKITRNDLDAKELTVLEELGLG